MGWGVVGGTHEINKNNKDSRGNHGKTKQGNGSQDSLCRGSSLCAALVPSLCNYMPA